MPGSTYSALVAQKFANPAHAGDLAGRHEHVVSGRAGQREHGTQVIFQLGIDDDTISEARFRVFGCPHTVAACELVAQRLTGQGFGDLIAPEPDELAQMLDLPEEKMGRLFIVQDALRDALVAWDNTRLA